jgi:hypothetical protein
MKRISTLLATLLCLVMFVSCEKEPVNEWQRFWGYTKDDIVGDYEANPDESIYEEYPTAGMTIYKNASIHVTGLSGDLVSIRINIPGVINKVFSGAVYSASDNSDLALVSTNGNDDIRMTVYKNSKGDVRFHGIQKRYHYDAGHVLTSSENYGFDVIKKAAE